MKKDIKEYKEIVNVVADIQENLEYNISQYEERKNNFLEDLKEDDSEYFKEEIRRLARQIKATQTVLDNLEKLL